MRRRPRDRSCQLPNQEAALGAAAAHDLVEESFWPYLQSSPNGDVDATGVARLDVGIKTDGSAPGGGSFIFKNSWGQAGDNGYGYLPFDDCKKVTCVAAAAELTPPPGSARAS